MGKDHLGADMRKVKAEDKEEKEIKALDEGDIALLKTYGQGQYTKALRAVEKDIVDISKRVNELAGIKESDTGLAPPALWDLAADKQSLQSEQPLQVARYEPRPNILHYWGDIRNFVFGRRMTKLVPTNFVFFCRKDKTDTSL